MGYQEYTDKYFLRTKEILEKEGLNPYVRAQVFVRKGPGIVAGMEETIEFIKNNSQNVKIQTLEDGQKYQSKETQMILEGNIQDFVELETCYLGILSSEITKLNDKIDIDLAKVEQNMRNVVQVAQRPVVYFGARHWHYNQDEAIAKAALKGGAIGTSTDIGSKYIGSKGLGTIPHVLENIMAYKYGKDRAVVEATKVFDKYMNEEIPRVALIDYNNCEITDSLTTAKEVLSLKAIRVDTCGENIAEGALAIEPDDLKLYFGKSFNMPNKDKSYWFGTGVTVSGVYALRKALDNNGYQNIQIMLTSGFGNVDKIRAFTRAEKLLETRLFDSLGVGTVFHSRAATMDIVAVGEDKDNLIPMSKVGRVYNPNSRLELCLI